jgi:hypothetical protein
VKRDDRKVKIRICPQCESRYLDKGQHICSDCRESNIYFSGLESSMNWKKNNPISYSKSSKKSIKKYRQNNREKLNMYSKEYMRELRSKEPKKVFKTNKEIIISKKESLQKYRDKNVDEIKAYQKEYALRAEVKAKRAAKEATPEYKAKEKELIKSLAPKINIKGLPKKEGNTNNVSHTV